MRTPFELCTAIRAAAIPTGFIWVQGQNALSANVTAMFDDPAKHLAYVSREVRSRGATVVEPPKEAEQAWGDTIRGLASTNYDFLKSCTPGYYNNEVAELGFGLLGQVLHTGR
jgi:cyclohexanone monooxygenase